MYKKVSTDLSFVSREKDVRRFWEENHIFEKSSEHRAGGKKQARKQTKETGDCAKRNRLCFLSRFYRTYLMNS